MFVIVCVAIISAFPICFPTIVPFELTVTISSFNDSYLIFELSTVSTIKLNLLSNVADKFSDLFNSNVTTFEFTCTYVSPITSNLYFEVVVPSPNSPYPLYPTVYTKPFVSDIIV